MRWGEKLLSPCRSWDAIVLQRGGVGMKSFGTRPKLNNEGTVGPAKAYLWKHYAFLSSA